jgi:hypothetical protein
MASQLIRGRSIQDEGQILTSLPGECDSGSVNEEDRYSISFSVPPTPTVSWAKEHRQKDILGSKFSTTDPPVSHTSTHFRRAGYPSPLAVPNLPLLPPGAIKVLRHEIRLLCKALLPPSVRRPTQNDLD